MFCVQGEIGLHPSSTQVRSNNPSFLLTNRRDQETVKPGILGGGTGMNLEGRFFTYLLLRAHTWKEPCHRQLAPLPRP